MFSRVSRGILATALFVLAGCFSASSDSGSGEAGECFRMTDGNAIVILRIEADRVTVFERVDGKDEVPPETAPGTRNEAGFRYLSGTQLRIADGQLFWPEESLLPGAVFDACDCP